MSQIIPVTSYPDQTFRIVLDGVSLSGRLWWSQFDEIARELVGDEIEGQWYLDLSGEGVALSGMAVVTGCDMLEPYAFDKLGGLWLLDVDGNGRDPALEGMGDTFQLIYVPLAERDEFNRAVGWVR